MRALAVLLRLAVGCVPPDPLCTGCVAGRCTECLASYLDAESGRCVPPPTILPHCLIYTPAGQCRFCQLGFESADEGCRPATMSQCLVAEAQGRCRVCSRGRLPDVDGRCTAGSYCLLPHCALCERTLGFETCFLCAERFAVSLDLDRFGTCQPLPAALPNCMAVAGDRCLFCAVGHFAVNDSCARSEAYSLQLAGAAAPAVLLALLALFLL